jgi:hypothetical protein
VATAYPAIYKNLQTLAEELMTLFIVERRFVHVTCSTALRLLGVIVPQWVREADLSGRWKLKEKNGFANLGRLLGTLNHLLACAEPVQTDLGNMDTCPGLGVPAKDNVQKYSEALVKAIKELGDCGPAEEWAESKIMQEIAGHKEKRRAFFEKVMGRLDQRFLKRQNETLGNVAQGAPGGESWRKGLKGKADVASVMSKGVKPVLFEVDGKVWVWDYRAEMKQITSLPWTNTPEVLAEVEMQKKFIVTVFEFAVGYGIDKSLQNPPKLTSFCEETLSKLEKNQKAYGCALTDKIEPTLYAAAVRSKNKDKV